MRLEIEGYEPSQIAYHVGLLHEAGLLYAEDWTHMDSEFPEWLPARLTWAGHEFLDAARNETTWRQARDKVVEITGGISLQILTAYLQHIAREKLGLDA